MNMWTGKSKEMKNIRLRQRIDRLEKDDPKGHRAHQEIAIVSGGIPEEGNPHLKTTKRSRSSCLAVKVMPGALVSKPPPMVTIDNRNQSLVISVVTINTMIRRVVVDQGISADILFRRCFDAPGLTEKDLKAHSDNLVRCLGKRLTQIASSLCGSPSGTLQIQRKRNSRHARIRPKFLQPQDVCLPGNKPVAQKWRRMNPKKPLK
ncbi:hypothetical protein PIB30_000397 [Stylosanthes scabra]|uniref:Uncharacterized protein n=1 Tax=Stylosanthes scabra TaxID=79078 RepID=A0ABU6U376_9FABA|nr:hypothetical protein [Stylosanthes scabra]